MKKTMLLMMSLGLLALAGSAGAEQMEIAGLLGMSPVPANAYAAVWIPVPSGQALAGVRWYNNDGTAIFPQVLVAGGAAGVPAGLEGATEAASSVQGVSFGWSQVTFSQAFAGQGDGLYCLFVFPEGSEHEFQGAGGGTAFGYTANGGCQGWFCADADAWMQLAGGCGLAVEPVLVPAQQGMVQLSRPQVSVVPVTQLAELMPAHPNPFNPQTVIEYSLPEAQQVELSIFDLSGRMVRRLEQGQRTAGNHSVTWQGEDDQGRRVPSGMYLARFTAGRVSQTQRLMLVK